MNNEFIVADILFFINYVFGKLALLFLNKTFISELTLLIVPCIEFLPS